MKSLPRNPNLEFLKKEARALRALHRQGDMACCERIRENDISLRNKTDAEIFSTPFSINDAQRIIAREYGYSSWATLKQYVESLSSPLYNAVSDRKLYQQRVAESYDNRSDVYDNHVWAREWSLQIIDICPPRSGETVLDLGCSTGNVAFNIADKVGPEGLIIGVDISTGMISRCKEKLKETSFTNLEFMVADAENLDFPPGHFDRMYASAILPWLINPQAALRHWCEMLKPGGWIGLTAWPSNSFVWGDGERQALRKYGIHMHVHEFSGTKEKTQKMMELAGFGEITIHVVERGRWMEPESVKGAFSVGSYSIGQYPHHLANVPDEIVQKANRDYNDEVDRLTTEQGVWHDMTTFFVCARKNKLQNNSKKK